MDETRRDDHKAEERRTPRRKPDEDSFRGLVENAVMGIYRTTPDGRILMANPALVRMLGFSCFEELATRNLESGGFGPQSPRTAFLELMEAQGSVVGLESAWYRADGSVLNVRESARAVHDGDGRMLYYEGIVEDITDRKRTAAALQSAHGKLRATFDAFRDAISVVDLDFTVTDVNKGLLDAFGLPDRESLIGGKCYEVFKGRKDICPYCVVAEAYRTGAPAIRISASEDVALTEGRTYQIFAYPIVDEQGKVTGAVEFGRDITDRIRAEERHALVIETALDGFWLVDGEGRFLEVNESCCRMLGYTREEMLTMSLADVEAAESPKDITRHMKKIVVRGHDRFETRHRRKDGRVIDVEASVNPAPGGQGGFVCFTRDVTDRKRAEEALRESEEKYRDLFEGLADAAFLADPETGLIIEANAAAEELLGRSRGEIVGMHQSALHRAAEADKYRQMFAEHATQGPAVDAEAEVVRKDGATVPVRIGAATMTVGGRRLMLGLFRDVTEMKKAQARLRESEEKHRLLVENSGAAITFLDGNGTYLFLNGMAAQWLAESGVGTGKPEDYLGRTVHDAFPEDLADMFVERINRIMTTGLGEVIEETLEPLGRSIASNLQPVRNESGEVVGVQVVTYDITERRRAEEALTAARARLATAREHEQRRLAGELHDSIGQGLVAMQLAVQNAAAGGQGRLDAGQVDLLTRTADQCTELIREVRQICRGLYPLALASLGLVSGLRQLVEDIAGTGTKVDASFSKSLETGRLDADVEIAVFRIAQEAINNAVRHSKAGAVALGLKYRAGVAKLTVADDGVGFDPDQSAGVGLGLTIMAERAQAAGGKLDIHSEPGATRIEFTVPAELHRAGPKGSGLARGGNKG